MLGVHQETKQNSLSSWNFCDDDDDDDNTEDGSCPLRS